MVVTFQNVEDILSRSFQLPNLWLCPCFELHPDQRGKGGKKKEEKENEREEKGRRKEGRKEIKERKAKSLKYKAMGRVIKH